LKLVFSKIYNLYNNNNFYGKKDYVPYEDFKNAYKKIVQQTMHHEEIVKEVDKF